MKSFLVSVVKSRFAVWGERYAVTLLALGMAWLLKRHYSQASAEELRWILGPTAALTSLVLDRELTFRPGEGYLSRELSILISPACAGVNFLIVAFLSLVLSFGRRLQGLRRRLTWLVVSAASAYLTTLLVSALRISLSVAVAHLAARAFGLTFQSVHRLLGITVYLAGLGVLCLTVQAWFSKRLVGPSKRGALQVALGCYVAMTLLVPLLRGAYVSPDYWSHAASVSVLVGALAALLFAAGGRTWDDGRHAFRSPQRDR